MSWRGAVQTPASGALGHVAGFKNGAKLSTGTSRNINVPDRSPTENVVAVGVVVVVVVVAVVVVVVVVNALNANAITEATASKPALIFLIPFIFLISLFP